MLAQQRVELRFDRADRNEVSTGAFIDAVEMRAAVEKILLAVGIRTVDIVMTTTTTTMMVVNMVTGNFSC